MVEEHSSRILDCAQDDRQGVAALSPQFDLPLASAPRHMRVAAPIGSLSPKALSYSSPLHAPKHNLFQTVQPIQTPTSRPEPPFSPLVHPQFNPSPSSNVNHLEHDFDRFGLASLDLGPASLDLPPPQTYRSLPVSIPLPIVSSPSLHSHHQPSTPNYQQFCRDANLTSPLPRPSHTINPHSASPLRTPRELAHPTRCVLLRNIPPGIDDDDIRRLMHTFGPLRDLGAQQRSRGGRGSVLVTYFDLRHARAAVRALDATVQFGRRIEAKFQCPSDQHLPPPVVEGSIGSNAPPSPLCNQGTIVVFNLDPNTTAEEIRELFSSAGDVKEIRSTPNKKHHKFVEFYDVRDAERAIHILNKTELRGKRIKIEISRPGGRAGNFSRHSNPKPTPSSSALLINNNSNNNNNSAGALFSQQSRQGVASQPFVSYPIESQSFRTPPRPQPPQVSQGLLPQPSLLPPFSQASPVASSYLQLTPTAAFNPRTSVSPARQPVLSPGGFDATNALGGAFDHAFHTTQSATNDLEFPTVQMAFIDNDQVTTPGKIRSDAHSFFTSSQAQRQVYPNSAPPQPTVKHPPDSYLNALYHSPSSERDATPDKPRVPFASMNGPGAPKFRATFSDAVVSGSKIQGRIEVRTPVGTPRKIGTSSATPERTTPKHPNGKTNGHSTPGSKPGTQNPKYKLDIMKVRSGEETRTALMIRNIPNKYNQKMLLSTLDEGHRGHFDFMYLPIDFKNKCNVGYAFINFKKTEFIEPFYNAFHGKKWGRFNSEKICEITFARIQGLAQLKAHFANSSLMNEDPKLRPILLGTEGMQEDFPVGAHVRTRRGPSSRESAHRSAGSPSPYSPSRQRSRG